MNYQKNSGYSKPKIQGIGTNSLTNLKITGIDSINNNDTERGTNSTYSVHFSQNTLQTISNSTFKKENLNVKLNSSRTHNKNKSALIKRVIPNNPNSINNFVISPKNNQTNNFYRQFDYNRNHDYSNNSNFIMKNNLQQPIVQYIPTNYPIYDNEDSYYPENISENYTNTIRQKQNLINSYQYNYDPNYEVDSIYDQNTLKTSTNNNNNILNENYNYLKQEEKSRIEPYDNYNFTNNTNKFIMQQPNNVTNQLNQTLTSSNNLSNLKGNDLLHNAMFNPKSVNDLLPRPISNLQQRVSENNGTFYYYPSSNTNLNKNTKVQNSNKFKDKSQIYYLNSIQRGPQYSQNTNNSINNSSNLIILNNKKSQSYMSKNISNLPSNYKSQNNNFGIVKVSNLKQPQGVIKTVNILQNPNYKIQSTINKIPNYANIHIENDESSNLYQNQLEKEKDTNYNLNYQTLNKIDKCDLTLNVEDLLLHEEKLSEIIEELTSYPGNPCYEWWVFFVSSSLSGRLENFFKDETSKKIITKHSVLEFIIIILCYDCETNDILVKTEHFFTQAFSYISNSLMLFCDYVINKINYNTNNIWVNKLKNLVKIKLKLVPNNKEENINVISYNNDNLVSLINKIIKEFTANSLKTDYMDLVEKFLIESSSSTLLILSDIFRNKVLKFKNTNKSVIASALTQNLNLKSNIEQDIAINNNNANANEYNKNKLDNKNIIILKNEVSNTNNTTSFKHNEIISLNISNKNENIIDIDRDRDRDFKKPYIRSKIIKKASEYNFDKNSAKSIDSNFVMKNNDIANDSTHKIARNNLSNIKPADIESNPSMMRRMSTKLTSSINVIEKKNIFEKSGIVDSDKGLANVQKTDSKLSKCHALNGDEEYKFKNADSSNYINSKDKEFNEKFEEKCNLQNNEKFDEIGVDSPFITNTPLTKKFCLVLDLDETLVHFKIDSKVPNQGEIIIRPYLYEFLNQLSPFFELIMFTAATEEVRLTK